jgi:hypothetical protein
LDELDAGTLFFSADEFYFDICILKKKKKGVCDGMTYEASAIL